MKDEEEEQHQLHYLGFSIPVGRTLTQETVCPSNHVLVTSQQKEKKMKKQLLALRNQDTTNHSRRTKGRGNTRRLSEGWS